MQKLTEFIKERKKEHRDFTGLKFDSTKKYEFYVFRQFSHSILRDLFFFDYKPDRVIDEIYSDIKNKIEIEIIKRKISNIRDKFWEFDLSTTTTHIKLIQDIQKEFSEGVNVKELLLQGNLKDAKEVVYQHNASKEIGAFCKELLIEYEDELNRELANIDPQLAAIHKEYELLYKDNSIINPVIEYHKDFSVKLSFKKDKIEKTGVIHLFRQLYKLGLIENTPGEIANFIQSNINGFEDTLPGTIETELKKSKQPSKEKNLFQIVLTYAKQKFSKTYIPELSKNILEIPME